LQAIIGLQFGAVEPCARRALSSISRPALFTHLPWANKKVGTPDGGRWAICSGLFDGNAFEFGVNSRLMIVRCGSNYDAAGINHPDVYYLLWEGNRFRELLHIKPPREDQTPR